VRAAITSFLNQSAWLAANGGSGGITVFSFQGPTETGGKYANDPIIQPSYASQGVVFLPFVGTTTYPVLARGQQYQISAPLHDGLLTNNSSPKPTSDLEGRAIRFNFIIAVRAVGLNFNGPVQGGDMGYLEALDYSGNQIGQTPVCAAGGFIGLVADTEIAQVHVVNTGNSDIRFGIWDLQFKEALVSPRIQLLYPGARVSWPATAQNYSLESTGQLSPSAWQTVTNSSVVVGNELTVPVETNAPQWFFRLARNSVMPDGFVLIPAGSFQMGDSLGEGSTPDTPPSVPAAGSSNGLTPSTSPNPPAPPRRCPSPLPRSGG